MSLALKFSGRLKSGGPLALALFLASAAYSLVPRYTVGTGITWLHVPEIPRILTEYTLWYVSMF